MDPSQKPPTNEEEELPACDSCRRRKLKCSRELPICQNCSRLEIRCLYDYKKQKPGLKSGAVERLNQRLVVLEKLLLVDDQFGGDGPQYHVHHGPCCVSDCALVPGHRAGSDARSEVLQRSGTDEAETSQTNGNSKKRKRLEPAHINDLNSAVQGGRIPPLPQSHVIEAIIDTYFKTAHHWIPLLHERRFRARLRSQEEREKLSVVLFAMTSVTLRLVDRNVLGMDEAQVQRLMQSSKNTVLLNAFDGLLVENLQALAMIVFDSLGGGVSSKAWSLIGSLTRTVEYLQLTVESDEDSRESLLKPLSFLDEPEDWTEAEERRRVFWNIFLLDRFCSITTGWSTSLTSDLVRRRLPCDGGFWTRSEPVTTPFFGIWDKSAGRIGNSIAHIPDHYPSPHDRTDTSPGSSATSGPVDVSTLGAFAYCVEASESLSQVTTFFLQQRVDFKSRHEVGSWLTRFKELDLRLVHWKMFLPQKWKDSNISREPTFVNMDPNLTLAHLTHDCSMILLHQHIAYPRQDWAKLVKLPSSCSAETCQLAAVEIANIGHKYLKYTAVGLVNGQFAFCAFVAARVLLVHSRFYTTPLAAEFFHLLSNLKEMSRRWRGNNPMEPDESTTLDFEDEASDLAANYAKDLIAMHANSGESDEFCAKILGYKKEKKQSSNVHQMRRTDNGISEQSPGNSESSHKLQSPESNNRRFPPSTTDGTIESGVHHQSSYFTPHNSAFPSAQLPSPSMFRRSTSHSFSMPFDSFHPNDDELTAISHTLLGNDFMEMDRVITLDGTDFSMNFTGWDLVGAQQFHQ